MTIRDTNREDANKALIRASFDDWATGSGGPFTLLAPDAP